MTDSTVNRRLLEEGLNILMARNPDSFYFRDDFIETVERYLDEVEFWNDRVRLISGDRRDIIIRHFFDSLAAYPAIRSMGKRHMADVGSGNGFPALALLLLDGSLSCSLIERGGKKAAFLRNAISLLRLGGRAEVIEMDLKRLSKPYPLIISRAFMPIRKAYPLIRRTVGAHADIVFYAGTRSGIERELDALGKSCPENDIRPAVISLDVPFLPEERHLCIFASGGESSE